MQVQFVKSPFTAVIDIGLSISSVGKTGEARVSGISAVQCARLVSSAEMPFIVMIQPLQPLQYPGRITAGVETPERA
jgi:hypothetical protein